MGGLCLSGLTLLAACTTNTRAPVVDLSVGQTPAVQQPVQAPVPPQTQPPLQAKPPTPTRTPAQTSTPPRPVTLPARASTYVVKPGDTLYSIARAAGTSVADLVHRNQLADPTQLSVGQVLTLAGSSPAPTVQPATTPAQAARSTVPTTTPTTTSTTPPPPKPAPATLPSTGQWGWPASGNIIQSFSAATKGIDIAGTPGDPVRAAADGKVAYSGNGVRGLGNLIIINHASGFISAYAHNRTLLVKAGQEVKRGTQIAELGQTDTSSPRLHFEMRRQGTPVNPLQYLPKR